MKKLLHSALCFAALSYNCFGQDVGYTIQVNWSGEVTPIATIKTGEWRDIPIVGNVEIHTVFALQSGLSMGIGLLGRRPLGSNIDFLIGPNLRAEYINVSDKIKVDYGIIIGVSWRL